MRTSYYPLLIAATLATGIAAALFLGGDRRVPQPATSADEASMVVESETNSVASLAAASPYSTYRWEAGEHACWQLAVSLRLASAPEQIAQGDETRLGGDLHLVVLSSDSNEVTLAGSLNNAYYVAGGTRVGRAEELLNSTPALLTLDPAGNIRELVFPRHVAAEDYHILRSAYGWEFVARNESIYQEEERAMDEAAIRFQATYRRLESSRVSKRRIAFAPMTIESPMAQSIVASEFTGMVGPLWLAEMSGWEDTAIYFNGSLAGMSRLVVSLKARTNAVILPVILSDLLSAANPRLVFSSGASQDVDERAVLMAEQSMSESMQALRELGDWLLAHPADGPEAVLQSLQSLDKNDRQQSGLLIYSLAKAQTAPAREALVSVLQHLEAYSPIVALQAAAAAGSLGAIADSNLKTTLLRVIESPVADDGLGLSETALLSFARLARDDAASQEFVVRRVAPWLQSNATPEETVRALSVLGNAAVERPDLVARATELAGSFDDKVREAAEEFLGGLSRSRQTALD